MWLFLFWGMDSWMDSTLTLWLFFFCHLPYWPNLLIIVLYCCPPPLFSRIIRGHFYIAPHPPALSLFFTTSVTPRPCLSVSLTIRLFVSHPAALIFPCQRPQCLLCHCLSIFLCLPWWDWLDTSTHRHTHMHARTRAHNHTQTQTDTSTYLNRRQGQHLPGV